MAITYVDWYGVKILFEEREVQTLLGILSSGAGGAAAVGAALAAMGVPPGAVISLVVAALVKLAEFAIKTCDSAQKGIALTILWIALPWCVGRQ